MLEISRFSLKKEFDIYKTTGVLTDNLKKLHEAIKTLKPTSTDSERVFSIAGSFCNKKRSSLSDKPLNCLTFLKSFFF